MTMGTRQEGPRGFELVDEADKADKADESGQSGAGDTAAGATAPSGPDASQPAGEPLPPMTFGAFVLSLSTSALMSFGETPAGVEGAPEPNLDAARQVIEILEMLEQKTSGNLDDDERKLIQHALHDLRMRFVEAQRA
jgi:hypothetical protein